MKNPLTSANINLNGVLRGLQYLCQFDQEAQSLIASKNVTILFKVRLGPSARLIFKHNQCRFEKGSGQCHILLWFSSVKHFNAMIEGQAAPIILSGFTKVGFLTKEFAWLTKRLQYFLQPGPETANDPKYQAISRILTFYTAFYSLVEIGMHDPVGKLVVARAQNGLLVISIADTGYRVKIKIEPGRMETVEQSDGSPEVQLTFKNLEIAGEILAGRKNFLTAIGFGEVRVQGFMPLLLSFEHLMPLLNVYFTKGSKRSDRNETILLSKKPGII